MDANVVVTYIVAWMRSGGPSGSVHVGSDCILVSSGCDE